MLYKLRHASVTALRRVLPFPSHAQPLLSPHEVCHRSRNSGLGCLLSPVNWGVVAILMTDPRLVSNIRDGSVSRIVFYGRSVHSGPDNNRPSVQTRIGELPANGLT